MYNGSSTFIVSSFVQGDHDHGPLYVQNFKVLFSVYIVRSDILFRVSFVFAGASVKDGIFRRCIAGICPTFESDACVLVYTKCTDVHRDALLAP